MKKLIFAAPLGVAALASCSFLFPFSLDSFSDTRVQAFCHFAYACCTPLERSVFMGAETAFKDEGACVAEIQEEFVGFFGRADADRARDSIARGAAEFDAEAAERCSRASLEAANACDPTPFFKPSGEIDDEELVLLVDSEDPECVELARRAFTIGKLEDGDECDSDIDCADFGICAQEFGDDTLTTKGTCHATLKKGAGCLNANRFCGPGLFCTANADGGATCEEPDLKANGEACGSDFECESGACEIVETGACINSGLPCVVDEDCDVANFDFCQHTAQGECTAPADLEIEVCDGLQEP